MTNQVKIVECPRDAWQGLRAQIPTEVKSSYLQQLIAAGFTHIDAVSFVSPAAVPQMADAEQVLALLSPPAGVEIIGVVVNRKGAERAIATGRVQTLGFPYSISRAFLERNQHQTPDESLKALQATTELARQAGLNVVAYISMAFGNPYGESWNISQVAKACELLVASGVRQISLADTVGSATPAQISELFGSVRAEFAEVELGIHLHARSGEAAAKIRAAYQAGCRRFDAALGGLGGCPFAQDTLVGNIPTEVLVRTLGELGAELPTFKLDDSLLEANDEIVRAFGATQTWAGGLRVEDRARSAYATILITDDGPVRTITLNRPERRNALTPEMQQELIAAMQAAAAGDSRVLVLRGAGNCFCSGLDLTVLQEMADKGEAAYTAEAERIARLFRTLYEFPKPTIAVVLGAAIGGGAGLATICDFTLAAPASRFGYPEVRIGFVPAVVSTFLALQIGDKRTRDLLLTGRLFDAAEAQRLGLVSEVVDADRLPTRVAALAATLMECSPKSLAATKRLMAAENRKWQDAAIAEAMGAIVDARKTDDLQEGVAAFLEKRKPAWAK